MTSYGSFIYLFTCFRGTPTDCSYDLVRRTSCLQTDNFVALSLFGYPGVDPHTHTLTLIRPEGVLSLRWFSYARHTLLSFFYTNFIVIPLGLCNRDGLMSSVMSITNRVLLSLSLVRNYYSFYVLLSFYFCHLSKKKLRDFTRSAEGKVSWSSVKVTKKKYEHRKTPVSHSL